MAEMLQFDQVLYSWSQSNLFGRRGFGVVAASAGWLPLLQGGDDILSPVVAYPEPGRGGAHPPAHGGFALLRGNPVVFRRVPSGTDSFDRPGNYTVQVLIGAGEPVDADLAAGLLAAGWLDSPLPGAGPTLPLLELPRPGPRRGSSSASAVVCGALLQGLRDRRRVVMSAASEAQGRLPLCDAVRRLPAGLVPPTFSTLEAEPDRSSFDVAVAVSDWAAPGPGRDQLHVDIESGAGSLDPACERWGRELATTNAGSLRGIPEPVTVASLGDRLDGLVALRTDPARLTPQQLLSVLTCPEGQAWAAEPGAAAVVGAIVSGMDPALGPQFAKAAARRPAVSSLLSAVGWDVVSGRAGVTSRRAAETLLLGLGEKQNDIDMAVLSSSTGRLSREDSARYLRLVQAKGGGLDGSRARLTWDPDLAAAHPGLWFEAVILGNGYQGPRAGSAVLATLTPAEVASVLSRARAADPTGQRLAGRLWALLPTGRREQTHYLRLLAASGPIGLGLVFEHLLAEPSLDARVRTAVLTSLWPILVHEMQLPGYLAEAMQPSDSSAGRWWPAAVAALMVLGLVVGYLLLR